MGFFMLYKALFILVLCFSSEGFAQKILLKEFDAQEIEKLIVNADRVFSVKIATEETQKIFVTAKVQGENFESVMVSASEENGSLKIEMGYTPFYKAINDKLAAHKVISVDLEIRLPKNMFVSITSDIASIAAQGDYQFLYIGLENGNCDVKNFRGDGSLQTKQGNISVYAKDNVAGSAFSKTGQVLNDLPAQGKYYIKAESIGGIIKLLQTN